MGWLQFVSEDPEKSISTFLLTAAAVGMLFKVCKDASLMCLEQAYLG